MGESPALGDDVDVVADGAARALPCGGGGESGTGARGYPLPPPCDEASALGISDKASAPRADSYPRPPLRKHPFGVSTEGGA